ncbi:MAG TPA: glycosyltransferase family 2 protein [Candidatus Nanoarchaeia archaeon]|nr:glycosyltransferase family 2 protein [Candidatus Nanoarchaeia archaeon]
MNNSHIGIIVPFVSWNTYVKECVDGCRELDYDNWHLILVPDSPISLPEPLQEDKRISIVVSGDVTIARKRNLALNTFQNNDYYACIDSDAYPEKSWLKNAVTTFAMHENVWAVGGPNICPKNEAIKEKAVGNSLKSFLVSGTRAFRKKISSSRFCVDLPTCNLIISKETIESLKGFNENLITGEDIEFCNRIVQRNKKIYYANNVIVYHHNRPLWKPFFLQRITYGLSVFKVFRENKSLFNIFLFLPLLFLLFIVSAPFIFIYSTEIRKVTASIILGYFCIVGIETLRYTEKRSEIPLTFLALLMGNISPGIGSLLALLHIKVDIKKIYKNFNQETK